MPHQLVVPVVRKPDYQIGFEQFDDLTLVHVTFSRWNREVYRNVSEDFNQLYELHGGPLFAISIDDPRQPKFLKMFGFRPVDDCRELDGTPRTLYQKD